jgi:glycosyltransferase involved in cell wall biosynthesis
MAEHLDGLWTSLRESGLVGRVREVIVVDDGSSDGTAAQVDAFIATNQGPVTTFRSLRLPDNRGRFRARFEGARLAEFEFLLFLDTRLELPSNFADKLFTYLPDDKCLQGLTRIRSERGRFDLYWDRTHAFLFRRYFRDVERGLVITVENYDQYPKGTTAFACPRAVFLSACERYEHTDLLNDDTALLRHIVETHPIHVRPDFEFYWFPRRSLGGFLARIWERGPSSVEYHVFESRGTYFRVLCFAGLMAVLQVVLAITGPQIVSLSSARIAAALAATDVAVLLLTTALFARGAMEFVVLAPLHLAVVLIAGASVLRGVIVVLLRRAK